MSAKLRLGRSGAPREVGLAALRGSLRPFAVGLRAAGVDVARASDAEAAERRVAGMIRYTDLGGVPSALAGTG